MRTKITIKKTGISEKSMYFTGPNGLKSIVWSERFEDGYRIHPTGQLFYGIVGFMLVELIESVEFPEIITIDGLEDF